MAKKSQNAGFQASAGLIRYFDAEEKSAFRIPPMAVIILSILTGVGVIAAKVFIPL